MRLVEYLAHVLIDWCVLSCIVVGAYAVAMSRMKRRRSRRDDTHRATYPPPVPAPVTPPFTQTTPSADWFDGMPCDVLSDDAVRSLFDRLVDLDDNLRDIA